MGAYINPVAESKENWLKKNGKLIYSAPESIGAMPDHLPVCVVDNGPFTAAGIAFNDRELQEFSNPNDRRPKTWFWVEKAKLIDSNVSDLAHYLKD